MVGIKTYESYERSVPPVVIQAENLQMLIEGLVNPSTQHLNNC